MNSSAKVPNAFRHRWAQALHHPSGPRSGGRLFNLTLSILIFANVLAVVIETLPDLPAEWMRGFDTVEKVSLVLFALEYVARVWTSVEEPKFSAPIGGRLRYITQLLPLIDLLVLLSFFAPFDLRFLRLVRIVKMLRVLHLDEFVQPLHEVWQAIKVRRHLLVIAFVAMMMLMFFAAAGMYYIEHEAQPKVFSSIPAAMWWAVMTLTTVGYGDAIPHTPLGKFFAAVIATCGIGVFALPMAILTAAILDVDVHRRRSRPGDSE